MSNPDHPFVPTEEDRAFYERELASFVPDHLFDAHCHLWTAESELVHDPHLPATAGLAEYQRMIDVLHPGRGGSGLFLAYGLPAKRLADQIRQINAWTAEQVAKDPNCRGFFFVRATDDPEWVRQEVRRLKLHGLKCYHDQAAIANTWDADIPDYLPERLVKVAHEEGWGITLHMVKARAVADPSNIHWIRHYCTKYPNMNLILAHSARGFQPAHNLEGLPHLTGLDNLYFDTSANCEPIAHEAIIRIIGHDKLMYGSDFWVSHLRGRSLGAGDSFLWLTEEAPVWGDANVRVKPILVGLEHLRSVKWACWSARLDDSAVEDIFWNNAAKLFGLKPSLVSQHV